MGRNFMNNLTHFIFVIDSNDSTRFDSVKKELSKLLTEEQLKKIPLLIFLNKQDLPNATKSDDIKDILDLYNLIDDRNWFIQPSCFTKGIGIQEGFEWIVNGCPMNSNKK